jgi:hypothetical protein
MRKPMWGPKVREMGVDVHFEVIGDRKKEGGIAIFRRS